MTVSTSTAPANADAVDDASEQPDGATQQEPGTAEPTAEPILEAANDNGVLDPLSATGTE